MPIHHDISDITRAIEALRQSTGLVAHTCQPQASEVDLDGYLSVEADPGGSYTLPYEIKSHIDRRDQLLTFKAKYENAVLITDSLSSVMAGHCRDLDIQFIDHAGNCFLHQSGLFVFVSGFKEHAKERQPLARGLAPATLRVVFAALTRPEILNSNVRKIAQTAAISLGAASTALIVLEESGFLSKSRTGRRMMAMPQRWLDAWTEGYLGRIRPKLEKLRMSAPVPVAALLDTVSPQFREVVLGGQAAAYLNMRLGGEAAAAERKLGLKPGALTLYMDFQDPQVLREFVQEFKLRRDPDGPIELVSMFWNTQALSSFPAVPDALIYADLVGTGDERTLEIASILRKEICAYVESQA